MVHEQENEMTEYPAGRRAARSWMAVDWAMQPYHTLIISAIFAPYFTSTVIGDGALGQEIWGRWAAISGIMTACTAPILSSIAERSGHRKWWLFLFMIIVVTGTSSLFTAVPGGGATLTVMWGFIFSYMFIELSFVLTNAVLPDIAKGAALGRTSGTAWGIGFISGILLLLLILLFLQPVEDTGRTMILGLTPPFGITIENGLAERLTAPIAAVWYLVFMIPFFLFVPDKKTGLGIAAAVRAGLGGFATSLKTVWRVSGFRNYLIGSMLYRDALAGLFVFGGIYARNVLGFSTADLGVFGLLFGIAGVFGAIFGGRMDGRYGPRVVIFTALAVLILVTSFALATNKTHVLFIPVGADSGLPALVFYFSGTVMGAMAGALQTASRTYVVHHAEGVLPIGDAFGLFALSGRATAFLVPSMIAGATALSGSAQIGATPLLALFIAGFLLLVFAKPLRG